jgi:hypothetical protein
MSDFKQDLLAGWFRCWDFDFLKRFSGFNDSPGAHGRLPHVSGVGSMGTSLRLPVKRWHIMADPDWFDALQKPPKLVA